MKAERTIEPHLVINEFTLRGMEWIPEVDGWYFIQARERVNYRSPAGEDLELSPGSVLITAAKLRSGLRAVAPLAGSIVYFFVVPGKLLGLLTLDEQEALGQAAERGRFLPLMLPHDSELAERFGRICQIPNGNGLVLRLQLLQLLTDLFESVLKDKLATEKVLDGRARLRQFLRRMVASEFVETSLTELAPQLHCSPRHLSRLFREEVGISFQDKKTNLRLARARKLLRNTKEKVIDVGAASGFQSYSLFSLMFKKRFGVSPGEWRRQNQ